MVNTASSGHWGLMLGVTADDYGGCSGVGMASQRATTKEDEGESCFVLLFLIIARSNSPFIATG